MKANKKKIDLAMVDNKMHMIGQAVSAGAKPMWGFVAVCYLLHELTECGFALEAAQEHDEGDWSNES